MKETMASETHSDSHRFVTSKSLAGFLKQAASEKEFAGYTVKIVARPREVYMGNTGPITLPKGRFGVEVDGGDLVPLMRRAHELESNREENGPKGKGNKADRGRLVVKSQDAAFFVLE